MKKTNLIIVFILLFFLHIGCLKNNGRTTDESPCIIENYYGLTMHEMDLKEFNVDSVVFKDNIYTIKTSSKTDSDRFTLQIYRDDFKPLESGKVMIYRHKDQKDQAMIYDNIHQAAIFKVFKDPDLINEIGEILNAGPICVENNQDSLSLFMNFKLYPLKANYGNFYCKLGLYKNKTIR